MTDTQTKTEYFEGLKAALPIAFPAFAFGMLFGATAVKSGLSLFETMLASATMFAGASQFVFLEIYGYRAPAWSIVLAVFAVNFRHVLYSASLGRHMWAFPGIQKYLAFFFMVDPAFGAAEHRASERLLRRSFYFGYVSILYAGWMVFTAVGAKFGALISNPQALGLDFIFPVYFVTLVMGFRYRPNWTPVVLVSAVASGAMYFLIGPPWHITLGSLFGIGLAIIIAKPGDVEMLKPAGARDDA